MRILHDDDEVINDSTQTVRATGSAILLVIMALGLVATLFIAVLGQ
jgi:citrate synthase